MEVYLDNSATTKPREEVIESMTDVLRNFYGNPSSLHRKGLDSEKLIKEGRETISRFLKVKSEEIFFTSGGTESNNIAVQGFINKNKRRGKHLITTCIEHPSILNIFKAYEAKGYEVTYLSVDENGLIDLEELETSIRPDTILLSVMLVNNEIGIIQPISKISSIVRNKNKNTKIHVDAVQAYGKILINMAQLGVDSLSFSAHKFYGPKGIGGLYLSKNSMVEPLIIGSSQERGIRAGTENVPGIVGMAKATEILEKTIGREIMRMSVLKRYFIKKIEENIERTKMNSLADLNSAPHILNVSFEGVKGEVLLHFLERNGVFVSTGAACSSKSNKGSHVLKAIGLNDEMIDGTIRFSLAYDISEEQIDYVVEKLKCAVEEIRIITKR